jgi:diaminopimelate decarboxylase
MAAQLSHVYPLGSRVTEAGHLELGGCDAIELAREFGTPAYVVVEDDMRDARAGLRRRLRRALRGLRGPLRLQGLPVHGGAAAS